MSFSKAYASSSAPSFFRGTSDVATDGEQRQPRARRVVTAAQRARELQAAVRALGLGKPPTIGFPRSDGQLHARRRDRLVAWLEAAISEFRPTAFLLRDLAPPGP